MSHNVLGWSLQDEALTRLENDLPRHGFSVIDGFLDAIEIRDILKRFKELQEQDAFKKAGIGKMIDYQVNHEIRNDIICWIDPNHTVPVIQNLYQKMRVLIDYFSNCFFLGLKDIEMHYALYQPGKYYLKHKDQFRSNPHRIISVVHYFNPNWQKGDGGELRIYHDSGYTDVEPIAGRLLVFKSEMEHEVLETAKQRYSITGWMLDQPMGLTFL